MLEFDEVQKLVDIKLAEDTESVIQDKIKYRRKRVNQLRLQGYTNREIAEKIGCNLSTIEKDLQFIREISKQWFEEDVITEYCQSLNDSIILYDNTIEDLQILYAEEDNIETKLRILSTITEFEEKKTGLYEKTKSVQHYLIDSRNFLSQKIKFWSTV